jgi:hypothetical protein
VLVNVTERLFGPVTPVTRDVSLESPYWKLRFLAISSGKGGA